MRLYTTTKIMLNLQTTKYKQSVLDAIYEHIYSAKLSVIE